MRMRCPLRALAGVAVLVGGLPAFASAAGSRAADPLPQRLVVRAPSLGEPCPAAPAAAPAPGPKCATLVAVFEEAIPSAQELAITGAAAMATHVWSAQTRDLKTNIVSPLPIVWASTKLGLTGLVFLVLDPSVQADAVDSKTHFLTVTYLGPPNPTEITTGPSQPDESTGALVDAEDPDDADLLFSGKVAATKGDATKFNFEARIRKEWFVGRNEWGGLAEVVAKEQQDADPDSIKVGLSYERVIQRLRGKISALPLSGEFSRDEPRTKGFVASGDFIWNALPTQAGTVAVDVVLGAAVGNNFKNAISDEGSGRLGRGKVGVQAWTRWDGLLGFEKVTLSGTWTMLALMQPEIDPERLDGAGLATLTKRSRHRFTADLALGFTSRLALGIEYRQGPLPPAFEKIEPSVGISLVYKADWR